MGFKLRLKNVQQGSGKASPFKINDSLVMGAGVAAKGFGDLQGGYNQGLNQGYVGFGGDGGSDTDSSEAEAKKQTCAETGLTGEALETCQENKNKEFLENDKKRIEAEAEAEKEKACKDEGFKNCAAKERGDSKSFLEGIFTKKDKEEVLDDNPLPASNTANE